MIEPNNAETSPEETQEAKVEDSPAVEAVEPSDEASSEQIAEQLEKLNVNEPVTNGSASAPAVDIEQGEGVEGPDEVEEAEEAEEAGEAEEEDDGDGEWISISPLQAVPCINY